MEITITKTVTTCIASKKTKDKISTKIDLDILLMCWSFTRKLKNDMAKIISPVCFFSFKKNLSIQLVSKPHLSNNQQPLHKEFWWTGHYSDTFGKKVRRK